VLALVGAFILNFQWAAMRVWFSPKWTTAMVVSRGSVLVSMNKTVNMPLVKPSKRISLVTRSPEYEDGLFGFVEWRPRFQSRPTGWALIVPFWVMAVPFVGMVWWGFKRTVPAKTGCAKCGYNIERLAASNCPECGSPINNPPACASSTSPPA